MRPLLLLFALLFCFSCRNTDAPFFITKDCITERSRLCLEFYDYADVDTILVRTFINDGSFSAPVKTQFDTAAGQLKGKGTITNVYSGFDITTEFDYEIIVPALSDTIKIWGLELQQNTLTYEKTSKSGHYIPYCRDSLRGSVTVNDTPVKWIERIIDDPPLQGIFLSVPKP